MARMLTTPTMTTWTMIYLQEDPGMLFVCAERGRVFGVFVVSAGPLPSPFLCEKYYKGGQTDATAPSNTKTHEHWRARSP